MKPNVAPACSRAVKINLDGSGCKELEFESFFSAYTFLHDRTSAGLARELEVLIG